MHAFGHPVPCSTFKPSLTFIVEAGDLEISADFDGGWGETTFDIFQQGSFDLWLDIVLVQNSSRLSM